jgi:toxin ParE1/3/4
VRAELSEDARTELAAAASWYEERSPGLGDDFAVEVLRALEAIEEAPETWPPWPGVQHSPVIHRFLLPGFPFALPYIVLKDRIVILAIAHVRQRPGYWLKRTRTLRIQ